MFGHNDNQQHDDAAHVPVPTPDALLDDHDDTMSLPGAAPSVPHLTAPSPSTDDTAAATPATAGPVMPATPEDLLNIKQEALQQLSPLIGHLEQSAEEKFRTTMMLIQATDDHTKLKDAYTAAKEITDDKVRAQALLDVVNEINYFTQSGHQDKPSA